jgi:hypothetical protein
VAVVWPDPGGLVRPLAYAYRLDVLTLVVPPIALIAAEYTLALDSGVRQRSGAEPLLALLIAAGFVSWAVSLRWAKRGIRPARAARGYRPSLPVACGRASARRCPALPPRPPALGEPPTLRGEGPQRVKADRHLERL